MEAVIKRLEALESRVANLESTHARRLDGHDTELADMRRAVGQIQADVGRIFNVLTTQGLSSERIEKTTNATSESVQRLIRILEERK